MKKLLQEMISLAESNGLELTINTGTQIELLDRKDCSYDHIFAGRLYPNKNEIAPQRWSAWSIMYRNDTYEVRTKRDAILRIISILENLGDEDGR